MTRYIIKIRTALPLLVLLLSVCSCQQNYNGNWSELYYVKILSSENNVSLDVNGTPDVKPVITLTPADEFIEAETSEKWCRADIVRSGSGLTLDIEADFNDYYEKTCVVTVYAGKGADRVFTRIEVYQEGSMEDPKVTAPESVLLNGTGTAVSTAITTNMPAWKATSADIWCKAVKQGDNTLLISADPNDTNRKRNTIITVTATDNEGHDVSTEIVVTQDFQKFEVEGIALVRVEGGTFKMGAQNTDPAGDNYAPISYNVNESPVHSVTVSTFYLGQFIITQKQWYDVMGTNPSRWSPKYDPDDPSTFEYGGYALDMVDWNMATNFCKTLSESTGKTFRLPTEAEWEYAARGGVNKDPYLYSGSDNHLDVAWTRHDFGANYAQDGRTQPGGMKAPNSLNIYDMCGNLYEWVSDWYDMYSGAAQTDPTGPAAGLENHKVMRGGSWWHNTVTIYWRGHAAATYKSAGYTGFRVVYMPN